MHRVTLHTIRYFPCAGQSNGELVTQTKGSVLISQGESVLVNCTYEAASPSLFWYVQFPSQPPRLFLRDVGWEASDEGTRKGFDATYEKKDKSFHLWKPASELSDSATYYCAARDHRAAGELSKNLPGAVAGIAGSWEQLGWKGRNSASTGPGAEMSVSHTNQQHTSPPPPL
uniref:Ig-like domain-containing protein n=1 Tax=Chrysemys picta bellii TaxID=8478 RepID=A0A8C3HP79_CHRPI